MKVLAILLVCAVAVQGRSTAVEPVKSGRSLAAPGDAPWLVHLRIAVSTSGLLQTASGSLISNTWVLTTAAAVDQSRFIWIRYGAVNVVNPKLVTEASTFRLQAGGVLALIPINRYIEPTPYISPVSLGTPNFRSEEPVSTVFYFFGLNDAEGPGEQLGSINLSWVVDEDSITATSDEGRASKFDIGAPLVVDGQQIAVLIASDVEDSVGIFQPLNDATLSWIAAEAGL